MVSGSFFVLCNKGVDDTKKTVRFIMFYKFELKKVNYLVPILNDVWS